jgi:hypothetical protein
MLKAYTLDRDIKSIAAVHKLRRGSTPLVVSQSGHIFVTTNSSLAYASRRFELGAGYTPDTIPVCMTDVFLGTILWLQSPAVVATLNETRLVAQCAAVMRLDNEILKKIVKVAERLKASGRVTEDQYYLLRASSTIHEMLAERTLGDAEAFSAKTVDEVFAEIEDRARSKEFERYRLEKESHDETHVRLATTELVHSRITGRLDELSTRVGAIAAQGVFGLLVVFTVVLLIVPFSGIAEKLIAVALGLSGLVYEVNFHDLRSRVKAAVEGRVRKWLAD